MFCSCYPVSSELDTDVLSSLLCLEVSVVRIWVDFDNMHGYLKLCALGLPVDGVISLNLALRTCLMMSQRRIYFILTLDVASERMSSKLIRLVAKGAIERIESI